MTNDGNEQRDNETYFSYYAQLMHQQNMLSDSVRTQFYQNAIRSFAKDSFTNKVVCDIGAGSGILSFFALQNGAKKVLAVEASAMADKMKKFVVDSNNCGINTFLADTSRLEVLGDKVETIVSKGLIRKQSVDTIISEPIGVLLVHERMLESFILARKEFLKEDGSIFPTCGTLHLAPVTDHALWTETMTKARWWQNPGTQKDYGVNFNPLFLTAKEEVFQMCVVGPFQPGTLLSHLSCSHKIDFRTAEVEDLYDIDIDLNWIVEYTGIIHGIGGRFDCEFMPGQKVANEYGFMVDKVPLVLSTHPGLPTTHWQQIRFLFSEPLAVNANDQVSGFFKMKVNNKRSYDITCEIGINMNYASSNQNMSTRSGFWKLEEQTYHYPQLPQMGDFGNDYANPEAYGMYGKF